MVTVVQPISLGKTCTSGASTQWSFVMGSHEEAYLTYASIGVANTSAALGPVLAQAGVKTGEISILLFGITRISYRNTTVSEYAFWNGRQRLANQGNNTIQCFVRNDTGSSVDCVLSGAVEVTL